MRKFYQSKGMLRAGRPQRIVQHPFAALIMDKAGCVTVLAHTDKCAMARDHAGWPKAFARATAGIDPHHLLLYACSPEQAAELAISMTNSLRQNGLNFGSNRQLVLTTAIEHALRTPA